MLNSLALYNNQQDVSDFFPPPDAVVSLTTTCDLNDSWLLGDVFAWNYGLNLGLSSPFFGINKAVVENGNRVEILSNQMHIEERETEWRHVSSLLSSVIVPFKISFLIVRLIKSQLTS